MPIRATPPAPRLAFRSAAAPQAADRPRRPPGTPGPSRRWGGRYREGGHPARRTAALTSVLAPAALTLALGLWGIRRENTMWRDESTTYQVAHRAIPEIWHMAGNVDAVHSLYYLLMHAVFALWDGGLAALRLPSVLAMSSTAAAVGLAGRTVAGPRVGLAAGLVFPCLPLVQRYAQEGRSYAAVCALVAWSTCALLSAWTRPCRRRWTGYAVLMLAACLLHVFAFLALLAHGTTLLLARPPRRAMLPWGLAACAVAAGLAPLALVAREQSAQVAWIPGPDGSMLLGFLLPALLGAACAATRVPAQGPVGLPLLACPLLLLPGSVLLACSLYTPVYLERYVLHSQIGLALLLGGGADRALRAICRWERVPAGCRRALAAALAAAAVLELLPTVRYLHTPRSRGDDVTAAARAVRRLARPGDGLLFVPGRRREPLMSYPESFRGLVDLAKARDAVSAGTLHPVEAGASRIAARMAARPRIVVVSDPPGVPQDTNAAEAVKRALLRRRFQACADTPVHGLVVTLYARPGRC